MHLNLSSLDLFSKENKNPTGLSLLETKTKIFPEFICVRERERERRNCSLNCDNYWLTYTRFLLYHLST